MARTPKFKTKQATEAARGLRQAFEAGRIGPGLEALLDSVDGPKWKERGSYRRASFDEVLVMLEEFVAEFGHARVPQAYRTSDGYALGGWVMNVRTGVNGAGEKKVTVEQRAALERLSGWTWDARKSRTSKTAI